MSVQKAKQLWEAVLGDLQLRVSRPSFETWLRGTVGVGHSDGQFVVGTPNTFVAEMLDQRMYSLISQSLGRVVKGDVNVEFRVLSALPAPASVDHGQATGETVPTSYGTDTQPQDPSGVTGPNSQSAPPRPSPSYDGLNMHSRYTFSTFIVGKSNELAYAAAQAVAEKPGHNYNPLFIYSGVGLGKTHLLHAIGHHIASRGLSLIYATTEEFTNQYIRAIREGKTEEFRGRYRNADALLLDDIQFIIGKEQTQEGFFHTFNSLHMANRQIVITSDRPATALTLLEDRIRSRLAGGLMVDIQPPDLETRLAILRAKAEETGQACPPDVLQYLAERIHSNVRELEGCLNRVAAYAQLVGSPITLELAKQTIANTTNGPARRRVSDEQVLEAVSTYFSVDRDTLRGRRRDKHTALARQIAMYLLRQEADMTLSSIGKTLGGKDHTTVLHACQRIEANMNVDPHLRRDILNVREVLAKS